MDRPLWQILLPLFLIGLAAQRAAAGFVLHTGGLGAPLVTGYAIQTALALATAAGLWLGRPWTVAVLIALGSALAASAILESFVLGLRPALGAISEVLIVALSTGALALALRHELTASAPGGPGSL